MKNLKGRLAVILCMVFSYCGEDLKTDEEKKAESTAKLVQLWMIGSIAASSDPCNMAYYSDTSYYSEVVRTSGDTVSYCAPVFSVNSYLYDASNQKITSDTVSAGTALQCRTSIVNGVLSAEIKYSWYKKESSVSNTVRLVFTHTIQKNSSGTAIGVDNFTNYNKGDILYCCRKYSDNSGMCSSKVTVN